MANSGSFNTSAYSTRYLTFNWWINGQDVNENYTDIGWNLVGAGGSSTKWYKTGNVKVVIDGEQVYYNSSRFELYNGTTVASGTKRLYHDGNGNKSFSASAEAGIYTVAVNCSGSGSWWLTQIPRYAYFSKHWVHATSPNTVQILYRPDRTISAAQYSLNGGTWTNLSVVSGTWNSSENDIVYQVGNLSPNTSYKIETRIQYAGNLWTYTGQVSFTTKDIAKLTETPDVNIGSAHTIKWTNPSGASTSLKLCKTDGSTLVYNVGTVTGTSKSVTPTASNIYSLIPNDNSIKLRYVLTTTANGTSYTNTKDCTFKVTNSNPTFSDFTYQDTNATTIALTGNNQIIVNNYSNLKAIISTANKAVAKNSATMKRYKLTCGTKNISKDYSSSANVELSVNKVDSSSIIVYATDSRGNSTSKSKTATYKNYSDLAITKLIATRQQNGVGSTVLLEFEGTYWNNSFGAVTNAISKCIYQYKLASSNTWVTGTTQLSYSASNGKFSGSLLINGDLGTDGFNISNAYNIRLQMADKLVTKAVDITLPSGAPGLAIAKKGLAIKQKYDNDLGGALQVNGIIYALDTSNNTFIDIIKKLKEIESKL